MTADWPEWIQKALSQRFDEHTNALANQPDIKKVRLKLKHISDELKKQLEPEMFLNILDWEATVNHQHSMEKEWLYGEGVKDGMRLIRPVCCSAEDKQSKV